MNKKEIVTNGSSCSKVGKDCVYTPTSEKYVVTCIPNEVCDPIKCPGLSDAKFCREKYVENCTCKEKPYEITPTPGNIKQMFIFSQQNAQRILHNFVILEF